MEFARARAVYAGLLARPEAADALNALVDASQRELLALHCFEADQRQCHRDLVLQAAHGRPPTAGAASRPPEDAERIDPLA